MSAPIAVSERPRPALLWRPGR